MSKDFRPYPKQGPKPKKEPKPLKQSALKKGKKATGQAEVFERIAEEREWYDWITGEKLWKLTPSNFAHVLPKALNKFPLYKLYDKNIILASDDTHYKIDFWPESKLRKDPMFDKFFQLRDELKAQYPEIK